ncbi:MAG: glutathione S-transferase C-terminal domain-containing protein [Deltaproteobacteria bacterium]|nr:glutathione S-transferase C-terminal domain-containing protein [Deltaproteobacteria bacterium]
MAELVVRLRGLNDVVEFLRLTPQTEAPPIWPADTEPALRTVSLTGDLPILWSRSAKQVVARGRAAVDFLAEVEASAPPMALQADDVDALVALVQTCRAAGFAHSQEEYEPHYLEAFARIDLLEERAATARFLGGEEPGLADLWLFAVLLRFEVAYYGLYKVNRGRIRDLPELGGLLRDLYQRPGFAGSVDWTAIKQVHYLEDARISPKLRLPLGIPDLWAPHDRAARFARAELLDVGTQEATGGLRARGEWVRGQSHHRHWITADGSSGFPAEAGRYHLYIANNCPWCHRVALARGVLGLEEVISCDVLWFRRDPDRGWQFRPDEPGCTPDSLYGMKHVRELYERQGSKETSVPILFDKVTETIVSNESADIVRMLGLAFGEYAREGAPPLYPPDLADEIDALNAWIYTDINNGAYKAGFTNNQQAHELAYARYFSAMERLDRRLRDRRFLCGERMTEADLRLFPTLFRFDHVYYTRFRLDHRRLRDYVDLYRWLREMLAVPGIAEASNLDHCRKGYFGRNANQVVPLGPDWDFSG